MVCRGWWIRILLGRWDSRKSMLPHGQNVRETCVGRGARAYDERREKQCREDCTPGASANFNQIEIRFPVPNSTRIPSCAPCCCLILKRYGWGVHMQGEVEYHKTCITEIRQSLMDSRCTWVRLYASNATPIFNVDDRSAWRIHVLWGSTIIMVNRG